MSNEALSVEEFRAEARAWIRRNLAARSGPADPAVRMTPARLAEERVIQRTLFDGGFAGISWPVEYGGRGLTAAHQQAFTDEASGFRLPDFGVLGRTTFGICVPTMLAVAAPDLLHRHVPRVLVGEELWVQFFSEPDAGSDLAGVRTRATRDGDRWILNGAKIWSSGAYYADYGMCLARTDWDVPKHRGLTWFAVRVDSPGLTVRPIRQINGGSEFCEEVLDDVEVDAADVIGEVNGGWSVARRMLAAERGGGERGVLVVDAADDPFAPDLAAHARRVGRAGDPVARRLVAQGHIIDVVGTALRRRVLALGQSGVADPAGVAAYAKLAEGTFAPQRARLGLALGGGAAVLWDEDSPGEGDAALAHLTARGHSIAGGTNEMMRNVIGEQLLGLPREPSVDVDRPFAEVVRRAAGKWQDGRDERKETS
jgi:alkylation response protein AidB-like acyl-CoA dehydrogenase